MAFELNDFAMDCCGIVTAQGFSMPRYIYNHEDTNQYRFISKEDYYKFFDLIEEHQKKYQRNCAIITLANHQKLAREAAEERGYKCVTEFWNPNSHFVCYIYTKVLWEDSAAWQKAKEEGYEVPYSKWCVNAAETAPIEVGPDLTLPYTNTVK